MSKTTKPLTLADLPTNLDNFPAVVAVRDVYERAEHQRRECETTVEQLEGQLGGASEEEIRSLALRVLAGASLTSLGGNGLALVGRLADSREQLRIAYAAETLAHERLEAARRVAFDEVVPAVTEVYAGVVSTIARAMIEVRKAAVEELRVRDQYDGAGIKLFPSKVHPMPLPFDVQRVGAWVSEGVDHGLIAPTVLVELNALCPRGDWRIVV